MDSDKVDGTSLLAKHCGHRGEVITDSKVRNETNPRTNRRLYLAPIVVIC